MYASYGASWRVRGDHWPLTTPRQPLSSFYVAERAAPAEAFWLSLLSFRFRFVSLFRDASRLSSASVSSLPRLRLLPVAWPSTCVFQDSMRHAQPLKL